MTSEPLKIDTKGICLLCLNECGSQATPSSSKVNKCSKMFKALMEHLEINVLQLSHFSSSINQYHQSEMEDEDEGVDMVVSMCDGCTKLSGKLCQLYEELEEIKALLNNQTQALYEVIKSGEESEVLMSEFSRRMSTKNPLGLVNASIAENLRKETLRKCSLQIDVVQNPAEWVAIPIPPEFFTNSDSKQTLGTSWMSVEEPPIFVLQEVISATADVENCEVLCDPLDMQDGFNQSDAGEPAAKKSKGSSGTAVTCSECGKEFDLVVNLRNHQQLVHGRISNFKCGHCDEVFSHESQLRGHSLSVHPAKAISEYLPAETTPADLNLAIESVCSVKVPVDQDESSISCPYCDQQFPQHSVLKNHFLESHFDVIEAKVRAQLNGSADTALFPNFDLTSSETEPQQSQYFSQNSSGSHESAENYDNEEHMPLTKPKTPVNCPICGKLFSSQPTMYRHRKLHFGERPHSCHLCTKTFTQSTHLRSHLTSVHTMETLLPKLPPTTTTALVETAIKALVDGHRLLSKDAKNPYGCQFCSRLFPKLHYVRNHLLEGHFDRLKSKCESLLCAL